MVTRPAHRDAGRKTETMDDHVKPRNLQEWVTFAREVLELREGEAEVYGTTRLLEDENREVLRGANTAARGPDAATADDTLDR